MINISFDLNAMTPIELAALYVLLTGENRQRVWFAGVANCGEEDFRELCNAMKVVVL